MGVASYAMELVSRSIVASYISMNSSVHARSAVRVASPFRL